MNIFIHELKAYRRSTIIWTSALCLISILFLSIFPGFYKDARLLTDVFSSFSQMIRDMFGISPSIIASVLGFYSFLTGYVILCGAIQAMNIGVSLLSKETSGKTVDFLLTKPVKRTRILASKLLAALVCIGVTNIIYLVVASLMAVSVQEKPFAYTSFLMLSLPLLYVQLIFLALGFLVSVLLRKIKSVPPISLSVVFGFYFISLFSSAIKDTQLRFLTPFRYFDPIYILNQNAYELSYVLLGLLVAVVAITATFLIYRKKDIHAV
jgi:ABC-2 type transport system permease protein